ncbi:hypothetical protein [Flagellimonas meridianipacifica]|uniref:Uncharacterized protein n=1 Tax=Flagellimonas meridianipacifica TaxID=1080225 RepID=A0A2T0MJ56_9FLAO|nr:hypothetical protein [Allomuricauda pacifica]PRX57614.1 hypothetical protein CLV81_1622 [Allomuricauda pacifica]
MYLLKNICVFSFREFLVFSFALLLFSCSTDSDAFVDEVLQNNTAEEETVNQNDDSSVEGENDGNSGTVSNTCPENGDIFFSEENGLVSVEFENSNFDGDWELRNDADDVSGQGYMVWTGQQRLNQPGEGMATFLIQVNTPGTYQFLWKSSFRMGDNGTEHNDSWLRFPNATDFFGEKSNGSIVYPRGSGKEPNPEGSSSDGWFKIYRSGDDNSFLWQARTSDNDAHDIFVTFSEEGIYTMEVSARSSFHGIDRFLLFQKDSFTRQQAIEMADSFSEQGSCN